MKYASGKAAVDTVEAETSISSSSRIRRPYLGSVLKKKDDFVYLRFLDDVEMPDGSEANFWITLATHDYVPCKAAPEDMDEEKRKRWPETMTAVCRTQKLLQGEHEDCYICEHLTKPDKNGTLRPWSRSGTTFARALQREKVKITKADVDAGRAPAKALGKSAMRDVEEEVDELDSDGKATGNKIMRKKIFLVQQKWSNFFSGLQVQAEEVGGSLMDCDTKIIRTGEGLKTNYQPMVLPATPDFDMSDPETRAPYDEVFPFSELVEFIDNLHSDEYYGRFFDPGAEPEARSKPRATSGNTRVADDEDAPASPGKAGGSISKEQMEEMKSRMLGGGRSTKAESPAVEAEADDDEDADLVNLS